MGTSLNEMTKKTKRKEATTYPQQENLITAGNSIQKIALRHEEVFEMHTNEHIYASDGDQSPSKSLMSTPNTLRVTNDQDE